MKLQLSLYGRGGRMFHHSGLNWWNGKRRSRKKDGSITETPRRFYECEIRLPRRQAQDIERVFGSYDQKTIVHAVTHDGTALDLCLEGGDPKKAKQLASKGDKTRLGLWLIQKCLGLGPKELVTPQILAAYGRDTVEFTLLGVEPDGAARVLLDFSPP